jgi:hypothetical protein
LNADAAYISARAWLAVWQRLLLRLCRGQTGIEREHDGDVLVAVSLHFCV